MSTWTASSISRTGRMTIRAEAARPPIAASGQQGAAAGSCRRRHPSLQRATRASQIAEYLLDSLVTGIGPEAELLGFHDEEDLDRVVAVIRERTFAER